MKFQIVELEGISGKKAGIYSIIIISDQNHETLYDVFLKENIGGFKVALEDIQDELWTMGNCTGLRSTRIIEYEGEQVGDGISAICDRQEKLLRLYGILYGDRLAIIGGGGPKPFGGSFQKSSKLSKENYLLRRIKKVMDALIENGEIVFGESWLESSNETFIFNTDEYE